MVRTSMRSTDKNIVGREIEMVAALLQSSCHLVMLLLCFYLLKKKLKEHKPREVTECLGCTGKKILHEDDGPDATYLKLQWITE